MARTYVLTTAARNEEVYIEKTLRSIVSQNITPVTWVIVSDGSTDRTDEIVTDYAARYGFIKLLCIKGDKKPNFRSQVQAINMGYEQVKNIDCAFIGNVDADVSFGPEYYEKVLNMFEQNPRLGLAGGFIYEQHNGQFLSRKFNRIRSVAHAVQLFRRECYEAIGGYIPLPYGGSDWVAEIMVRMKGWEVRSLPELKVLHHKISVDARGGMAENFRKGRMDYSLGSHPLFEVIKCLIRVRERPYLLGGPARISGFFYSSYRREKRPLSEEFIKYLREEQMNRLKTQLSFLMHQFNDVLRIRRKE